MTAEAMSQTKCDVLDNGVARGDIKAQHWGTSTLTRASRIWYPTSPLSCACVCFDKPRAASATVEVLEGKAADGKVRRAALARARKEILFAYAYPRLDVEVSKKRNHLLKAPFCVHPKTGKARAPVETLS